MFTGIIEELGSITAIEHGASCCRMSISAELIMQDIALGDSIAVNGVCLTADAVQKGSFTADVMPQTLRMTSLAKLQRGSRVNLERAMAANGRFGGHMVSGHIDGTGSIKAVQQEGNALLMQIAAQPEIISQLVEKGSVAVDGISLTIAELGAESFTLSLIPHTLQRTVLLDKRPGDIVNLECDIIGKYVRRLLEQGAAQNRQSKVDINFLSRHGFC